MTQKITRLYATKSDADAAVALLKEHGFTADEILVISPPAGSVEELTNRIAALHILKRDAAVYAKKVSEGATFVLIKAPFGAGFKASILLDRHSPVDSGIPSPHPRPPKYDHRTPLSSGLRLPVQAKSGPLGDDFWGIPLLSSNPAPFSSWLRYATLWDSAAPLSTLFRLPLLIDNSAPVSASFGLPILR